MVFFALGYVLCRFVVVYDVHPIGTLIAMTPDNICCVPSFYQTLNGNDRLNLPVEILVFLVFLTQGIYLKVFTDNLEGTRDCIKI